MLDNTFTSLLTMTGSKVPLPCEEIIPLEEAETENEDEENAGSVEMQYDTEEDLMGELSEEDSPDRTSSEGEISSEEEVDRTLTHGFPCETTTGISDSRSFERRLLSSSSDDESDEERPRRSVKRRLFSSSDEDSDEDSE